MRSARALLGYFALAFAISWGAVLLAIRQPLPYLVFVAMLLGPSLASIGLTLALDGTRGLRELTHRLLRWRVGLRWYAWLLLAPALLSLVLGLLSRSSPVFVPTATSNIAVLALVVGLVAGVFEELGWTGFATPRLLRGRSWLEAGALLGIPWAVWHALPDRLLGAGYGSLWTAHMLEWIGALVAYRILMTWIYGHTKSLLLGMLLHASFTGSQSLFWPRAAPPEAELLWYGLFALALWVVVAVVVARTQVLASIAASRDEKQRPMPGDTVVPSPLFAVTHAITIDARPDDVWPWLAQMGARHRDVLPAVPRATDAFLVAAANPPHDLVLTVRGEAGPVMTWEHLLVPYDDARSRLVVRGRVAKEWKQMARTPGTPGRPPFFVGGLYRVLVRLPDSVMRVAASAGHRLAEARHLRAIKRRAEARVRQRE